MGLLVVPHAVDRAGEVAQLDRGQNLACARPRTEPRGKVERATPVPVRTVHRLADVGAHPDSHRMIRIGRGQPNEALLQRYSESQRLTGRHEHAQRFVAAQLENRAVVVGCRVAGGAREPRGQGLGGLVAAALGERGVAADVGEYERAEFGSRRRGGPFHRHGRVWRR